jgi:hypothetical protein
VLDTLGPERIEPPSVLDNGRVVLEIASAVPIKSRAAQDHTRAVLTQSSVDQVNLSADQTKPGVVLNKVGVVRT